MKLGLKSLLFSISFFSFQSHSARFLCEGRSSLETVFQTKLDLLGAEKVYVASINHLEVYLKAMGENEVELEVYDSLAPARHYASSQVKEAGDKISWALWSRDSLVDVTCFLDH